MAFRDLRHFLNNVEMFRDQYQPRPAVLFQSSRALLVPTNPTMATINPTNGTVTTQRNRIPGGQEIAQDNPGVTSGGGSHPMDDRFKDGGIFMPPFWLGPPQPPMTLLPDKPGKFGIMPGGSDGPILPGTGNGGGSNGGGTDNGGGGSGGSSGGGGGGGGGGNSGGGGSGGGTGGTGGGGGGGGGTGCPDNGCYQNCIEFLKYGVTYCKALCCG